MFPRLRGSVWLLALLSWEAIAQSSGRPLVERLPDGTELILVQMPGSPVTSLRYVFRSGAASDPSGKEGLAHLLEHSIFHGAHDLSRDRFFDQVARAGAGVNAMTTTAATVYLLDAPAWEFGAVARAFLHLVTTPSLPARMMEAERRVVGIEQRYHSQESSLEQLISDALFIQRFEGVIGTDSSRKAIGRPDLVAFLEEHYVPHNSSLVIAGDLSLEEARALAGEAILLPPSRATEAPPVQRQLAELPVMQESRARFSMTVIGYPLDAEHADHCEAVSELLQLRLLLAVHVRQPMASGLQTLCLQLRGITYLLGVADSLSLEANQLPTEMAAAFASLAKVPLSPRERTLLEQRWARWQQGDLLSAVQQADRLAGRAAQDRTDASQLLDLGPKPLPNGQVLRAVGKQFVPHRQIRIVFSPFSG